MQQNIVHLYQQCVVCFSVWCELPQEVWEVHAQPVWSEPEAVCRGAVPGEEDWGRAPGLGLPREDRTWTGEGRGQAGRRLSHQLNL